MFSPSKQVSEQAAVQVETCKCIIQTCQKLELMVDIKRPLTFCVAEPGLAYLRTQPSKSPPKLKSLKGEFNRRIIPVKLKKGDVQ